MIIIVTNLDGIIQRVNKQAVAEFGFKRKDELVGMHVSMLILDVINRPELLGHMEQRLATLTRKDGKEFHSLVASKKIKGVEDNVVVSYIRNIDQAKACFKCEKCD